MTPIKTLRKVAKPTASGPRITFNETHVLKTLEIIGEAEVIGRMRLAKELGLGEGVTRTLLRHLMENDLIVNTKNGSKLTDPGKQLYKDIKSIISDPVDIPSNPVTLESCNVAILVRKASRAVKYGMEQRDAAIRLGASGATTLISIQNMLTMPGVKKNCFKNAPKIQSILISQLHPKKEDVIIIGSASTRLAAELGAKAAALETLAITEKS